MRFIQVRTFDEWRNEARCLLADSVLPSDVHWSEDADQRNMLFDIDAAAEPAARSRQQTFNVPKALLDLAQIVACHRDEIRWELLYSVLWRITHGEKNLLEIVTDDDVHQLEQMKKAVNRDAHKMKAFVRFRKVVSSGHEEQYIAWHRPDHRIVRLVATFFARRFKAMSWTILTPDQSVSWDQQELQFGPGVPAGEAPNADELEELWKTYYASTFNPARIKLAAMKREMPVRHWPTLPETELIPKLLSEAPQRVKKMIQNSEGYHAKARVPETGDLAAVAAAAKTCQACDLHCEATQTVFGEGNIDAGMMLVGEQPGDQEDLLGRPFIGPAGELLDKVLLAANVPRENIYLTNAVKHFSFIQRGKRRLHKRPSAREIAACRPWLEAELEIVKPHSLVCLGATAAQTVLGRDFRISQSRGVFFKSQWCDRTLASWHPAAILRMPDPARQHEMKKQLIADLRLASDASSGAWRTETMEDSENTK